jgi:hypothetical protein
MRLELTSRRQLHSSRPPLPDVPAVYFISPTLANIRRVAEDLEKALYQSFHFNFSEPLPRSLLEELAASVARDGTEELVSQVRCLCYFIHLAPMVRRRSSTNTYHLSHLPLRSTLSSHHHNPQHRLSRPICPHPHSPVLPPTPSSTHLCPQSKISRMRLKG